MWLTARFIVATHNDQAEFERKKTEVLQVVKPLTPVTTRSEPESKHYVSTLSGLRERLEKVTLANYKGLRVY
jgi:hypothetical protein